MSATLGSTPSASTSKKHQKRSNSSVTGSTGSTTGSTKRRMKEYRIVIFGSRSVGKSSLVSVFLTGNFKESPEEETTESTFSKVLAVEGKFYLLDIVDTAGKEPFKGMTDIYIRTADGYIVVFSLTDEASFRYATRLLEQINQTKAEDSVPMILVGNKCDLKEERRIEKDSAAAIADNYGNCLYLETSAKDKNYVNTVFYGIILQIENRQRRIHLKIEGTISRKTSDEKEEREKKKTTPTTTRKSRCVIL